MIPLERGNLFFCMTAPLLIKIVNFKKRIETLGYTHTWVETRTNPSGIAAKFSPFRLYDYGTDYSQSKVGLH